MTEYESNSHKSKGNNKEPDREKKVEKVVSNSVKTKKKSEARKLADVFLPEDVSSVKTYILRDVFIPALKNLLSTVVTNGVDMLLYGESGASPSKKTIGSKVSYRSYYDSGSRREEPAQQRARSGYMFDDVIFDTRGDAERVLMSMDEMMAEYGIVSVGDFNELAGITGKYTDNKYGWTDIRNANVVRVRDGYLIKLPKALPLD